MQIILCVFGEPIQCMQNIIKKPSVTRGHVAINISDNIMPLFPPNVNPQYKAVTSA